MIKELEEKIAKHDHLYWDLNAPEISDVEYHNLTRKLAELDPDNPLLHKIHTPKLELFAGKVKLAEPMLSLDKAYSLEDILKWAEKNKRQDVNEELLIQPKYDGISAVFDGKILATRGDGQFGDDISEKIPLIELESSNYCGKLDRPVRGEIVFKNSNFLKFKKFSSEYKNYRNAIAGILGQKSFDEKARSISYVFEKYSIALTLVDYSLYSERVELDQLEHNWDNILNEFSSLDFPIDGIVVKFADIKYAKSLGNTAHHPRGEIAFKFTNKAVETKLLGVEWSFGKNCITPVALLQSVDLNGITIKRATLHNAKNIIDKDIMINDTVIVERAGDVIPFIKESFANGENRINPLIEICPSCKTPLEWRGPEIFCPNKDCFETNLQRISAAVKTLNIENLGVPTIRKMMETFKIKNVSEIFNLSLNDIKQLPSFQEKSANNLFEDISSAKVIHDYELLAALNIPGIGVNIAKLIFKVYSFDELKNVSEEDLNKIAGIGPERAVALVNTLKNEKEYIDELISALTLIHTSDDEVIRPTICFTGEMPLKRSFYEKLAIANNYDVTSKVTAKLSLLVAASVEKNSTKLQNAKKYGVKIVALNDFLKSINATIETEEHYDEFLQDDLFGDF